MSFLNDSKKLLSIACPLLFSRINDMAVFFIGFILIAKLGPTEFAASGLASSLYVTTIVVVMGILYAMGIKMSQALGARDMAQIRKYLYSAISLVLVLGSLAIGVLILVSRILPMLGQSPELVPAAQKMIYSFCIAMLPTLGTVVVNQLVTVLGKQKFVYITTIINTIVTIALFYPLMFGISGYEGLGIYGFGLALAVGNLILISATLIYVRVNASLSEYALFKTSGVAASLVSGMKEIVQLGLPMGVQFGAEIAAFSVITFLIGHFSVSSLAAAQVAQQVMVLVLCIPFTLSEAVGILVGQSYGNKDMAAVRSYGFSSQKLVALILTAISVLLFAFPKALAGIYIDLDNPALDGMVALTVSFLHVAAISQIFDGLRNTVSGALRGLNDSMYPMYVGIFIMWVISLPIGFFLAFIEGIGPIGFPVGSAIAFVMGSMILSFRFSRKSQAEFPMNELVENSI